MRKSRGCVSSPKTQLLFPEEFPKVSFWRMMSSFNIKKKNKNKNKPNLPETSPSIQWLTRTIPKKHAIPSWIISPRFPEHRRTSSPAKATQLEVEETLTKLSAAWGLVPWRWSRSVVHCGTSPAEWSHNFLNAGSLEAAGTALLLDLTGWTVASAPPAGQCRAWGQLNVLLVHTWWVTVRTSWVHINQVTENWTSSTNHGLGLGFQVNVCVRATWRVLWRGQRCHGVGQVEVGSYAQLALTGGWVRGGGRPHLLLPSLLLSGWEVAVDQRLQELNDQLGVVRYLCLLRTEEKSQVKVDDIWGVFTSTAHKSKR